MVHIDWGELPFTEQELKTAWVNKTYVAQVAEELNTTLDERKIKNIGKALGLPPLQLWSPHYSLQQLREAWDNHLSAKEVAKALGTVNNDGFKKRVAALGLPSKPEVATGSHTFTKQEFTQVWESATSVDEAARQLSLPEKGKTYTQLNSIAKAYNLPEKGREVVVAPTGEDTSTIIGDWIDWHRQEYMVSPTTSEIGQASRQVKELLRANYPVPSIKNGLYRWTLALRTEKFRPPSSMITQHAFEYARAVNARVQFNIQQGERVVKQIDSMSRGARIEERRW